MSLLWAVGQVLVFVLSETVRLITLVVIPAPHSTDSYTSTRTKEMGSSIFCSPEQAYNSIPHTWSHCGATPAHGIGFWGSQSNFAHSV